MYQTQTQIGPHASSGAWDFFLFRMLASNLRDMSAPPRSALMDRLRGIEKQSLAFARIQR
jgi:hypothetical protein